MNSLQSTKGVSWTLVVILLMLITVFGAFYIRYVLGQYIELQITRTLGIRLLLHGFGYAYNALYSLPSGATTILTTYPSNCEEKCIDCNTTAIFVGLGQRVVCNCTDGVLAEPNLLGLGESQKDSTRMVCDDFFLFDAEVVSLSTTDNIRSMGVVAILQAHPENPSFDAYGTDKIRVYTELPIDLIDYLGARSSLIGTLKELTLKVGFDYFETGRKPAWSYDTIAKFSNKINGLEGLLNTVFAVCSNESPFSMIKSLTIPSGNKIVKASSTELCEYKCYNVTSFEPPINCEWVLDFCYDFNEIMNTECDNCTCNKLNYEITTLCNGVECVGNTSPAYEEFLKLDIFTGLPVDNSPIEFNIIENSSPVYVPAEDLKSYCNCSGVEHESEGRIYCFEGVCAADPTICCKSGFQWCIEAGFDCSDPVAAVSCSILDVFDCSDSEFCFDSTPWDCPGSETVDWPLSSDCEITASCLANGSITISVSGSACDTNSVNLFVRNPLIEQKLTIIDRPPRGFWDIILNWGVFFKKAVEQEYLVSIINPADFANRLPVDYGLCKGTIVRLIPEEYPQSYEYRALTDDLNDLGFNLDIGVDCTTPATLKISITGAGVS